jgi:hypothetical protein
MTTIPESTARAFLDKYKIGKGGCPQCGVDIWVFQCNGQPHMITLDLVDHVHEKKQKPTITEIRKSPGGNIV